MTRTTRLVASTLLAGLAWACAPAGADTADTSDGTLADAGAAPGTPEALPARAPARFGFGSEASATRVAAWDVDVKPDGEGLPPGRGTVAEGEAVFRLHCVACHGATGTEGPYDRLVGTEAWEDTPTTRTVGNYWPYATTLYDYIGRAMPLDSPGSLTPDETYSVIAFLLHRNGIVEADAVMDATTLPLVEMPARDRFVPDDRLESDAVR